MEAVFSGRLHYHPARSMDGTPFRTARYGEAEARAGQVHLHDHYELYVLEKGSADFLADGRAFHLRAPAIFLLPPGVAHMPVAELEEGGGFACRVLWVDSDVLAALSGGRDSVWEMELSRSRTFAMDLDEDTFQQTVSVLSGLEREQLRPDADSPFMSRLLITQLAVHLRRCHAGEAQTPMRMDTSYIRMMNVHAYILQHLQDDLSVTSLAENFFMDKNTLARQFRQYTGYSPSEFIRRRRLEATGKMIERGVAIQEAARLCGYKDYSAFFRAFRQTFGDSPREYARKRQGTIGEENEAYGQGGRNGDAGQAR